MLHDAPLNWDLLDSTIIMTLYYVDPHNYNILTQFQEGNYPNHAMNEHYFGSTTNEKLHKKPALNVATIRCIWRVLNN